MIVSVIKKALQLSDEKYYENLYFDDSNKGVSKNFTFATYLNNLKREEDCFKVGDFIIVTVASPDNEFMIHLYNGLLKIGDYDFKNKYFLKRDKISIEKETTIMRNEILIKTLSPICIKNKEGRYLDQNDDDFSESLNYICDLTLKNYRGKGLLETVCLFPAPEQSKKQVVIEEIKEFTERTGKKYYYVNANGGIFKLSGNTSDLRDLYAIGLGNRRNQGFGLFDVIG